MTFGDLFSGCGIEKVEIDECLEGVVVVVAGVKYPVFTIQIRPKRTQAPVVRKTVEF